ncbi:MAG: hypothetical protein HYR87_07540 [Thaumarchaeota archaeon]|nr:hypothetical protein [Nitrososphaerota archaeon]
MLVDFVQPVEVQLVNAKLIFVFPRTGLKVSNLFSTQSTPKKNPKSNNTKKITNISISRGIYLSSVLIGSYLKRLSLFFKGGSIPKNYLSGNTPSNLSNPNKEIPKNLKNHIQPIKLKEVITINSTP